MGGEHFKITCTHKWRNAKIVCKNQSGRYGSKEEFIQGNLRLVLSIIQRFNRRGENVDDLFQVGCIGLIKP